MTAHPDDARDPEDMAAEGTAEEDVAAEDTASGDVAAADHADGLGDDPADGLDADLAAAVAGALGSPLERRGRPQPDRDAIAAGAAAALERRAAARAAALDDEDDEAPRRRVLLAPRRPASAVGGFKVLLSLEHSRRSRVMVVMVVAGLAMLASVMMRDEQAWWSAKLNLRTTTASVAKLGTLGLPLGEAGPDALTDVERRRVPAADRITYVAHDVDSDKGSVSVFANDALWAAASRDRSGVCLWALVGTSGWKATHKAGKTPTCRASDAINGASRVLGTPG